MSATPQEKALIRAALAWQEHPNDVRLQFNLFSLAQAVRISRQPLQGPEPMPCMVRAENSATMFCHLPQGHPGSEPEPLSPRYPGGFSYHQGRARNGSIRRFKVWEDLPK